jgi:hypothetical protein
VEHPQFNQRDRVKTLLLLLLQYEDRTEQDSDVQMQSHSALGADGHVCALKRCNASKQERVAVAVCVGADGCCGLLSCYWQAALSALT